MSQFADMTSSSNDIAVFLLSILVTTPSFMSISLLTLELWQFTFIRDCTEIRKSVIPLSEFCSVSKNWGKLEKPNVAQMPLVKFYWMLHNARVTAFTVSELLRENQQGLIIFAKSSILDIQDCSSIKKRFQHRRFPVNTETFLGRACFLEHLW